MGKKGKKRSVSPPRPSVTKPRSESPQRRGPVKADGRVASAAASSEPNTPVAAAHTAEFDEKAGALQASLQRRPSVPELLERHVIEGLELQGEAPIVSNVKARLEHQIVADRLKDQLQQQPSEDTLLSTGIIAESSAKVAPSLQAAQKSLALNQKRHHVNELLAHRPSPQELEASGVRLDSHVANSVAGVARALERHMSCDAIKHALEQRPDPKDLEQLGIYHAGVAPAIQPTTTKLEHDLARVMVARKLRRRPSREEMDNHEWFAGHTQEPQGEGGDAGAAAGNGGGSGGGMPLADARARYAVGLKAAHHLASMGLVTPAESGRLKDRILRDDVEVAAAVSDFEMGGDVMELLDAFRALVVEGSTNDGAAA